MKHKHRFIAIPFTGQNALTGKEDLFGFHLECEHCYKQAKTGDKIMEIKKSWWGEVIPQTKPIDYVVK